MIIAGIIYIISLILVYIWIRKNHSKGGVDEVLDVSGLDVFITIAPLYNTVFVIVFLVEYLYRKRKKKDNAKFLNRLYGVKK